MARSKLSRAVMEDHAPAQIEADTPERKRWRELEFYATPPAACRAGAELIKALDPGAASAWEPACGDGTMAICMKDYFNLVTATDIEPQGHGAPLDFLLDDGGEVVDWVQTNPPFAAGADFVKQGLRRARRGVAILQRLTFIEGAERYASIFSGPNRPALVAPFSDRVGMQLGPWNPKCSTATCYAWFIWDKLHKGDTVLRLIPPGTLRRLSKPDDVRRFTKDAAGPLI